MRTQKGSFYIEIMISLVLVGIIGTFFLPLFPSLIQRSAQLNKQARLESIAEYCGSYVFRWANFSRAAKVVPFSYYQENDELELSGETRVNKLLWASPPSLQDTYLTDHYKASITFHDTLNRTTSAGIRIHVWYDENLNSLHDETEANILFYTIIAEKESQNI
jgi:type II secretory pathway pseudopilin PulG